MAKARKTGGRQRGTVNKVTVEIRDAARRLLELPDYRRNLRTRLIEGKAPHMETLLFHYAYGKPKETVEQSGDQRIVIQWAGGDWNPPHRTA
jgi:hypothetical protein